jgi:TPR repeat protein
MTRAFIAAMMVVFFAAPVAAGQFEDAVAAYQKGDYATALRLVRPLANQGNAGAQAVVGDMYFNGEGVPQDYAEAAKWYRLAANQGNAIGQKNLGFMYHSGRGMPHNDAEAVKWYRLAADQGYAGAQNNLGASYFAGRGVPKDYVLAYMWFNLAAARGFKDAPKNRDLVARLMTPKQIVEAQKLTREWKPTTQPTKPQ